jgi:hypothetical protein
MMSIEQFELILCDTYEFDLCAPKSTFPITDFKDISYLRWAIDELEEYILCRLYPGIDDSIEGFIDIVTEFIEEMNTYSKLNPRTSKMFSIARDMATDIQELLVAME